MASKLKRALKATLYGLSALAVFILVSNLVIHLKSKSYIYENVTDAPEAETALILGAAVYRSGELSPVFQNRVDKAVELYESKKVSKILVSGDNSTIYHNEVNPVRNLLLDKGIPDADIYLDHAGFDTYSTMYRARDIFKVSSIIIVSQSFHLPRSVFIARSLGVNAYGISAENSRTPLQNYVREIFANEKAVFNLVFNRKPKFLGEEIPIDEIQDKSYIEEPENAELDEVESLEESI